MNERATPLAWTDFVHELADFLRGIAGDAPVYLVGGAVRDAWLRGKIEDLDLAVAGDAISLARRAADALQADVYVMDRERGVARLFVQRDSSEIQIDFAKLRAPSLEADLRDRDFTVNAMAAELTGSIETLIDPLKGAADLNAKVLRRCSPSAIADDPIRALRAVRLCAQFGLKTHPDTLADLRAGGAGLGAVSAERIRDEFFKLLSLDAAARGVRVLAHLNLLERALPGAASLERSLEAGLAALGRMSALLQAIGSRRTDNTAAAFDLGTLVIQLDRFRGPLQAHLRQSYGKGRRRAELLSLAALLHREAEPAELARSLMLSAEETRLLSSAVAGLGALRELDSASLLETHRFWHGLGESGLDALLLAAAVELGAAGSKLDQAEWLRFVEKTTQLLEAWFQRYDEAVNPTPLLNGADLQRLLEIKPGPLVGRLLRALREAQATGQVRTLDEARALMRRSVEDQAESAPASDASAGANS